jgi:hypothetical protein
MGFNDGDFFAGQAGISGKYYGNMMRTFDGMMEPQDNYRFLNFKFGFGRLEMS